MNPILKKATKTPRISKIKEKTGVSYENLNMGIKILSS